MNIDRAEIRRRNTIPSDAMPFKTGLVYTYDCGDFRGNLERNLEMAGYAGFEARRAEAKARGKLRGIGMGNIIEQTSQTFGETVMVRFDPGGTVTVVPGSISHGQGHETMYKIVVSDRLGIDQEIIRVAQERHRPRPARRRHVRLAHRGARRLGGDALVRQDHREGQAPGRPHAGGRRGRHRVRQGRVPRRRHRPRDRHRRRRQGVATPARASRPRSSSG